VRIVTVERENKHVFTDYLFLLK